MPFPERQRAGATCTEDSLADRPGDDARELPASFLLRQPVHAVPHVYHLGEHLPVLSHPGQDGQATALPGELGPRSQACGLRVLLLPCDDVEGLIQVTGVAERVSQMPGDQPGERAVACGVSAAEAVFQEAAGFGLIRGLGGKRQCRARRRGAGETGYLPQLGQVAVFPARWQGAVPYRVVEQCVGDTPATALSFISSENISYPSMSDPSYSVIQQFSQAAPVSDPPTTAVIDKTGHVVGMILGRASIGELAALLHEAEAANS